MIVLIEDLNDEVIIFEINKWINQTSWLKKK